MKANFTLNIDGYMELQELLEENERILAKLHENLNAIENTQLRINGEINQPTTGTDD